MTVIVKASFNTSWQHIYCCCFSCLLCACLKKLIVCLKNNSEFEDTTQQRVSGPGPLLGSRRGDYGSSPPTRGESNHPRGIYGKWGSRSSGQSDKDSDSQSDRESG